VPEPTLAEALEAAVKAVGGATREGQVAMAEAVARAMVSSEEANSGDDEAPKAGQHLLVQAGTGTGKSLACRRDRHDRPAAAARRA
jgi:ATP-dependent DNA helicase DinG